MKHWLRHPSLTLAVSAALALASGTAAALGLGQIEVRSRPGQPLLAEIPVISTTPGELEQLQARLASPETFARIGLEPPQGLVTDLRFAIVHDRAGRPIIRVTTDRPVDQPLVTFLLEVDWGQGRLVREYSALVDTPQAVAATAQPPVRAPEAAPSNIVGRQSGEGAPPPKGGSAEQSTAGDGPAEYGPVRRGETLSQIASRLGLAQDHTLNQAMIALLRANPDAFIDDNINLLKQGAVLRVPRAAEVAAVDAAQASQIVRDRMRQWREARRQAVIAAEAARAEAAETRDRGDAVADGAGTAQAPVAADARLEIVPPAANRAAQAGTQSGIQTGGEGQMLRQELQQTQETLAAREAELQELKSRVAELEQLQADQQRLLALKDTELAAAQQRLATTTKAGSAPPAAAEAPARDSLLPWLLGGAALLALLVGGWWMRRRPAARPSFRAPQSAASELAAAFPSRSHQESGGHPDDRFEDDTPGADAAPRSHAADDGTAEPVVAPHADAVPRDSHGSEPGTGQLATVADERVEPSAGSPAEMPSAAPPVWHTPAPDVAPVSPTDVDAPQRGASVTGAHGGATAAADAPANERLELAQAYLDLGDHDSARHLLDEVADSGDPVSCQRARRMLREID